MTYPRVCIDGKREKNNYLSLIAEKQVWLSAVPFKMLTVLALVRKSELSEGGWVPKEHLYYSPEHIKQYVYLLCKQIKNQLHEYSSLQNWRAVENDKHGNYRLITHPDNVRILDLRALRDFGDAQIISMINALYS